MIEKLKLIEERYEEINAKLSDPNIVGDQGQYAALMREYKQLTPIIEKFREYCIFSARFDEADLMIKEAEDAECGTLRKQNIKRTSP